MNPDHLLQIHAEHIRRSGVLGRSGPLNRLFDFLLECSIAGKAPKLTAVIRGTSSLDAGGLTTKDASVGAEGPSTVRVLATATAKVDARGLTTIEIGGNPSCTVKAEGSAVVTGCD